MRGEKSHPDCVFSCSTRAIDLISRPVPLRATTLISLCRPATPCKGFGGGWVVEVVENWDGNTYRAVYTVRYREVVYVLHVFEKKSKSGKATPKTDLDLIKRRLKLAEQEYQRWRGSEPER